MIKIIPASPKIGAEIQGVNVKTLDDAAFRTVYQAFLTAIFISLGIMAPVGYFASPRLLDFVNAAPEVKAEALPFLRIMFVFSIGMLIFFMLSGALRSAGDARVRAGRRA